MKHLFFTGSFFLLCLQMVCAQKVIKKSIVNSTISFVQIDASNCFEIVMETADTNEMIIEAFIDGEYKKDLELVVKEDSSTLMVSSGFNPNFVNPNDKLSAHKVISIALKIKLPEYKNVLVFGTSCNVAIVGNYKNLKVTLDDGRCDLTQVSEISEITTQGGDIIVSSSKATIVATSAYGDVQENQIPVGNDHFILRSTTGNIYLKKIE